MEITLENLFNAALTDFNRRPMKKNPLLTGVFREAFVAEGAVKAFAALYKCTLDETPGDEVSALQKSWEVFQHYFVFIDVKWYGRKNRRSDLLPAHADLIAKEVADEVLKSIMDISTRQGATVLKGFFQKPQNPTRGKSYAVYDSRLENRSDRARELLNLLDAGRIEDWLAELEAIYASPCHIEVDRDGQTVLAVDC